MFQIVVESSFERGSISATFYVYRFKFFTNDIIGRLDLTLSNILISFIVESLNFYKKKRLNGISKNDCNKFAFLQ